MAARCARPLEASERALAELMEALEARWAAEEEGDWDERTLAEAVASMSVAGGVGLDAHVRVEVCGLPVMAQSLGFGGTDLSYAPPLTTHATDMFKTESDGESSFGDFDGVLAMEDFAMVEGYAMAEGGSQY